MKYLIFILVVCLGAGCATKKEAAPKTTAIVPQACVNRSVRVKNFEWRIGNFEFPIFSTGIARSAILQRPSILPLPIDAAHTGQENRHPGKPRTSHHNSHAVRNELEENAACPRFSPLYFLRDCHSAGSGSWPDAVAVQTNLNDLRVHAKSRSNSFCERLPEFSPGHEIRHQLFCLGGKLIKGGLQPPARHQ